MDTLQVTINQWIQQRYKQMVIDVPFLIFALFIFTWPVRRGYYLSWLSLTDDREAIPSSSNGWIFLKHRFWIHLAIRQTTCRYFWSLLQMALWKWMEPSFMWVLINGLSLKVFLSHLSSPGRKREKWGHMKRTEGCWVNRSEDLEISVLSAHNG